ncbi:PREDICTED: FANCD2 opposite strand protein [Nanorana parkeri]|uniref:FANCD2 opposite strand protein n=1 Tax=Nanorana parkeri TaxID=125878 RepID=UPI0008547757|nr:PREDICTED: FANCD2 opposite strand protein [Nanorana parkeri]
MEMYQLWAPWTRLDESLQWLRHAAPKPKPYRGVMNVSEKAELELCRLLGRRLPGRRLTFDLAAYIRNRKVARHARDVLAAPRPISLRGLDAVFGHMITVQPPKWSGNLHVSGKSVFSRVVSRLSLEAPARGAVDMRLALRICRQLLYFILLLYTTYKKCDLLLQRTNSTRNGKSHREPANVPLPHRFP